jgi:GT2 family glycosyltransferase
MRFLTALLRTAPRRPKVAMEALYWHLTGKKVRARNRLRLAMAQSKGAYRQWMRSKEAARAKPDWETWPHQPMISVLAYHAPGETQAHFERRIAALEAQNYGAWELVLAHSREAVIARAPSAPRVALVPGRTDNPLKALSLSIATASGDYVLPLGHDVLLAPDALLRFAQAALDHSDAVALYADEDRISRQGRRSQPWFKPQWNAELFLAQDYLSSACIVTRKAAQAAPLPHPALSAAGLYPMLLGLLGEDHARVAHVPHVLAHRTMSGPPNADTIAAQIAAVAHHVAPRTGLARAGAFGSVAVEWPLPAMLPLVSIIIPTRDHVDLLRKAVSGVLAGTRYRQIEVLIVDNGSQEPETLAYLRRVAGNPRVRVIRHDAPFNYSTLNNIAAQQARGDYLCLLNNDVEIINEDWLGWLMRQAVRPGVGAVGAKLLYDDGTIQHAGVVIGLGGAAGHAHRFQPNSAPGYFARAHVPHYVSAVTGACLLVARAKFDSVGGLDEQGFAVAFNDVDLCLKLQAAGWRNLYEPRSLLIHHESKSRGRDFRPDQVERWRRELALLQSRWGTDGFIDPLHHPALDRTRENYLIRL